jgi:hypothetical protein
MRKTLYWTLLTGLLACSSDDEGRVDGSASGTDTIATSGTTGGPDESTTSETTGGTTLATMTSGDTGSTGLSDDSTGSGAGSTTDEEGTTTGGPDETETGAGQIEPCDVLNPEVTYVPPNVMLVLDRSGSMTSNSWDHDDDPNTPDITRWATLHQVVTWMVNQYDGQVHFGAKLYPTATGCGVSTDMEVELAPNNAAAVIAGIPPEDASLPGTALTPPQQGVETTRDYLNVAVPEEPRAMIVVMDGQVHSSCGTTQGFINALSSIYNDDGIPSYMVGIDITGQSLIDSMNDYAEAGGVPKAGDPKFYNSANAADLQQAMEEIIESVLSCTIDLDPAPAFPELTKIFIEQDEWSEVADCETEDGWTWATEHSEVQLCGLACDQFKAVQSAEVEYYCIPG